MKKNNPKFWQNSFKWQFGAYPFFTSVYIKAADGKLKNKYYSDYRKSVSFFDGEEVIVLQPRPELSAIGEKIIKEALAGGTEYLEQLLEIRAEMKNARDNCLTAIKLGREKYLEEWWPKVQKALSRVTSEFFCFDFVFQEYIEDLRLNSESDFKAINDHIANSEPSFMNKANQELLRLHKKYPDDFFQVHRLFVKKFGWFQNSYKGIFQITEPWLKNYLKNLKDSPVENKRKIGKKKILPKKYAALVKLANLSINFKDDKKKTLLIAVDLLERWLKGVCREKGWQYEKMRWLSVDEAAAAARNKNSFYPKKAERYWRNKKRWGMMTGIGYDDIKKDLGEKILAVNSGSVDKDMVKGFPASRGFYKGVVKVILNPEKDGKKLNKGDVLVTSMTRPEYLPLMNRAGAFITDEGGIACHAAIVAREAKKPCIIATKIATKVLKDGMLVEVDADKGIVKIIK